MSRKTMDEYAPPPGLYNIYPTPRTTIQQNDDTRARDLIDHRLNDETVTAAYFVLWRDAGKLAPIAGHLEGGDQDFKDAIWGINEGKRDVRNLRSKPEWPRRR